MAYVAVDLDGSEWVFEYCPCKEDGCKWGYEGYEYLKLPKGSIAKLIGRELTWDDEPVELVETNQQDKGI